MMYIPKTITTGMIKNQPPLPKQKGVFWRGSNGDVWVKGGKGTNSAGKWDSNTQNYWGSRGYTLIDDPNPPKQNNGNPDDETPADVLGAYTTNDSDAGSGTNAAGYTQAEIDALNAQYDTKINALRNQLGLIDSTQRQGLNDLNISYNNRLNEGLTNYGTQRTDNERARLGKLESVDNDARSGYEGLRRLIGLSGSANQSALQNAKFAVAKDASGKRADAIDMYGRNTRDIDTAEQQFRSKLDAEKSDRERSFLQGLLEQRNSLEAEIGDADMQKQAITGANYDTIRSAYMPYQQRIDANNAALNDLTTRYATGLNTTVERPQLADYTIDKTAIAAAEQTGGEDQFSPYSAFLNRKRREGQLY